jgi:septal ring factor EnvC (AmiA/AmiB activator)
MEQMDERDQKTDKSTRTQIKIALWSVASSAVLALVAAIFAGFSFFQDRDNNTSGDQWQAKLLTSIEEGNQQRSAVERENQALREQVKSMDVRIADLETAQRAAAEASKAASAERRETKPGSKRPPP